MSLRAFTIFYSRTLAIFGATRVPDSSHFARKDIPVTSMSFSLFITDIKTFKVIGSHSCFTDAHPKIAPHCSERAIKGINYHDEWLKTPDSPS